MIDDDDDSTTGYAPRGYDLVVRLVQNVQVGCVHTRLIQLQTRDRYELPVAPYIAIYKTSPLIAVFMQPSCYQTLCECPE
jgi:hypothetical protein